MRPIAFDTNTYVGFTRGDERCLVSPVGSGQPVTGRNCGSFWIAVGWSPCRDKRAA